MQRLKEGPVLAVDADPNTNLNELLGEPVTSTIGDARELMRDSVPAGMSKDAWLEMKVHEAVIEAKGFDLLVMGRPEGSGCYCAANSLVKKHMDLLKENYAWVVADNEAGMEHMSRLVTQDMDYLFVMSDPIGTGAYDSASDPGACCVSLGSPSAVRRLIVNRVGKGSEEELQRWHSRQGSKCPASSMRTSGGAMDREGGNIFLLHESSVAVRDAYAIFDRTVCRTCPNGARKVMMAAKIISGTRDSSPDQGRDQTGDGRLSRRNRVSFPGSLRFWSVRTLRQ